jgi:hypothetical protein
LREGQRTRDGEAEGVGILVKESLEECGFSGSRGAGYHYWTKLLCCIGAIFVIVAAHRDGLVGCFVPVLVAMVENGKQGENDGATRNSEDVPRAFKKICMY